jgi:hypothetical protein
MYPTGLAALLDGLDLTSATIKMQLLEGYTYSAAHDHLDDVGGGTRVGAAVTLSGKTVTGGAFRATVPTFASVTTGHTVDGLVVYEDTGTESTSRLVCLVDTRASGSTPLAIVTDGTDIDLSWGTNPIFTI